MASASALASTEPESGGGGDSACFICSSLQPSTETEHPKHEIVNCICNLFDLEPHLYHGALSEECICVKCQKVLQSVVTVFEEMERLHDEVAKSRKLLEDWLTASFGANQQKISTGIGNETAEPDKHKARVRLQGIMIGKDSRICPNDRRSDSGPDSLPLSLDEDEDVEYVVYEIDESPSLSPEMPTDQNHTDTSQSQLLPPDHDSSDYFPASIPSKSSTASKGVKGRQQRHKAKLKTQEALSSLNPDASPDSELKYACRICGKPFKTSEYALCHVETHNSVEKPFKCPHCDLAYYSHRALNRHVLKFHNSGPGVGGPEAGAHRPRQRSKQKTCDACGKTFRTPYMLRQHQESHKPHEERKFHCEVCGLGFLELCRMRRHMKRVHDPSFKQARGSLPKKPCPICSLPVVNLAPHLRVHSSEKSFACTDCGKSFLAKKTLDVHARIHSDSRPYPCNQCDAKFRTSHGLTRHTFIHSDERQFVCEHCGKAFRFKSSLSEHLHVHLRIKPYRCNMCGRRCKQPEELEHHLLNDHTPEQLKRRRIRARRSNCSGNTTLQQADIKYEFLVRNVIPATTLAGIIVPVTAGIDTGVGEASQGQDQGHQISSGDGRESKIRCTTLAHSKTECEVLMGYQLQYI